MTRIFALFALGVSMFGTAIADADRPVLVELFANQNCPACPKAHRTMKQIQAERDDVFILTWTVNYWDYLGDPDPMAMPSAKDRQMAYTDRLDLRAPYTPQSFYDGAKECPGTRKRDIRRNISARMKARTDTLPGMIWDAETGQISLSGETEAPLQVSIVEYLSGEANETGMVNPVTGMTTHEAWTGGAMAYDVSCERNCAALLHHPNVGEVLAVLPLN
ncbi:MAG: DUF1223 domain-containing protein [Pseudomonadota bacterium]